ncbi:MAG: tetratricopeptide repeat protein [Geminicoccaceae bacterium]
MTTTMSAQRIWAFDRSDPEMRAALASGWKRRDLWWERLQVRGNAALVEGKSDQAVRSFRLACWIAYLGLAGNDLRRATSIANIAFVKRLLGSEKSARRSYAVAIALWSTASSMLKTLTIRPRARSSLFHLRMEVKHWDTYSDNMKTRFGKFIDETRQSLDALSSGEEPPHRLYARWRGEKPAVFDDTRKLLGACLLVAS